MFHYIRSQEVDYLFAWRNIHYTYWFEKYYRVNDTSYSNTWTTFLIGQTVGIFLRNYVQTWRSYRVVDAPSRIHCLDLYIPHMDLIDQFLEQLDHDEKFQQIVQNIKANPEAQEGFQLLKGMVFF